MFLYTLEAAIFIDLGVLIVCTPLLLRFAGMNHSHPMVIYLLFHLMVVTTRLVAVAYGAPTLFSGWGLAIEPVTIGELVRAALFFDLALILATMAAIKASQDSIRCHHDDSDVFSENLQVVYVIRVLMFTMPVGIVGLIVFARLPMVSVTIDLGSWRTSTWLTMTSTWFGLGLIALIYLRGFKMPYAMPMLLYLGIMFFQGYHRFRVIIPIILLTQIYLDRKGRRWPTWWVTLGVSLLALFFFPMKHLGRMLQEGASLDTARLFAYGYLEDVLSGRAGDQQFLDMFASAITLTDLHGRFFLGEPYLKLLLLPIPRPIWPAKPSFADYLGTISTPWRPMGEAGMIVTYLGEAYANFSYFGIILIPLLLTYLLSRFHFVAYRSPYYSVQRFAYLLLAANLIQLYRDGLTAIVIFVFVSMMPLTSIVLLHFLLPEMKRKHRRRHIRVLKPDVHVEPRLNEVDTRRTFLVSNHARKIRQG